MKTNTSPESFENEVRDHIRDLTLERLSHREIVDRLAEQGYPRAVVIQILKRMTNQRRLRADLAVPLLIMVICLPVLAWGAWPVGKDVTEQLRTVKWIALGLGGFVFVPCAATVLYKVYDQIPGVNTLLRPILWKRRRQQTEIAKLDQQFLAGSLSERHYEAHLIERLGQTHGRSHFLFMRNQKHFGLGESSTAL